MELIYIAGPMSGYEKYNYPAFDTAEQQLRRCGYAVLNPTCNKPEEPTWDAYMRASIAQVIAADGIAVLPNWQMSRGAALEVHIAHALQVAVLPLTEWLKRVPDAQRPV